MSAKRQALCPLDYCVRPAERSEYKRVNEAFHDVWSQEPRRHWGEVMGKFRPVGDARCLVDYIEPSAYGNPFAKQVVGYAWAYRPEEFDPDHWLLVDVRVVPKFRRCGVGAALVDWLKDTLRKAYKFALEGRGLQPVTLDALVAAEATDYLRFLREHGFAWRETRYPGGRETYILSCLVEPL